MLHILAALAGGMLPALAWLWFWLREDSEHPEPRRLIALAFATGMAAVAVAILIEQWTATFIADQTIKFSVWSAIEEVIKYLGALAAVLWRREDDEPIDAVIYMITVALGFAALENTLFLYSPLSGATFLQTFLTGNLRFVGASLLHVLSSAIVGVSIAFSFYKSRIAKVYHVVFGLICAILLHSIFNFFILSAPEGSILQTFAAVWFGIIVLLGTLEYVKRIHTQLADTGVYNSQNT